jgi:predicted Zn finger-like uncharacterized protein
MALATRCPHCGKTFRVASDQLKLRGGIVRCGACHEIFDGNACLVDPDAHKPPVAPEHGSAPPRGSHAEPSAAAPPGIDAAPTAAAPVDNSAPPLEPDPLAESDDDGEPIYTLDLDHTFDPFGILPIPAHGEPAVETEPPEAASAAQEEPLAAAEPEPVPASEPEPELAHAPAPHPGAPARTPAGRVEPTLSLPAGEVLVAASLPGASHDSARAAASASAPLPMRESSGADFASAPRPPRVRAAEVRAARRSKLTPTKIAAPKLRVPEIDEPEFVKRGRQQEQSGKTRRILMAAGSLLLLLGLAGQAAYTFRNLLAARYPVAKPALAAGCKLIGCRVELPAQIDNLVIETGELTTLGGSTYALATLLRNQGALVQAWPHIELALTDANDKPMLRRVFTPAEYLPQGATPATGFGARAEQPVKLYFRLDQLKPSGYHIAVFYP